MNSVVGQASVEGPGVESPRIEGPHLEIRYSN